jgi:hypothetical protein
MTFTAHSAPVESDELPPLRGNLSRSQQELIDGILAFIRDHNIVATKGHKVSEAMLCKMAGVNHSLWSSLKSGRWSGDVDGNVRRIELGFNTLKTQLSAQPAKVVDWLETEDWRNFEASVTNAIKLASTGSEKRLTTLVGRSGAGKTTMLKRLLEGHSGTLVSAEWYWKGGGCRAMLRDIAAKIGIKTKKRVTSQELTDLIHKHFAEPRILVIQELSQQTTNCAMIAWWKSLLNETKAVLVLSGLPSFLTHLYHLAPEEAEQTFRRGSVITIGDVTVDQVNWFVCRIGKPSLNPAVASMVAQAANAYGAFDLLTFIAEFDLPADVESARQTVDSFRRSRLPPLPAPRQPQKLRRAA